MSCKAFGRLWLPRFVPLLFFLLACFALPQQAAAQTSADVIVSIAADAASVAEDVSGGNATFTVSLSQAVSRDVVLGVTYGAGSADLADGQPATGTMTFAANDTAPRQFTIATRNDTRDEGAETFTVTLSADDDNPLPDGVSIPSAGAAAETPCA